MSGLPIMLAGAAGVSLGTGAPLDVAQTLVSAAPGFISAFPALARIPEEGRDESRPGRQECLRHEAVEVAQ